jgi:signal transduction histidine kinase
VNEIPTLQALMDQTALALANIDQANLLHAYYQDDISRQEALSSKLVHDLHDDVLSQMALLAQSVDQESAGEQFLEAYQKAVQHIRDIMSGIRPTTLDQFGLEIALDELLDSLILRAEHEQPSPQIDLDVFCDSTRYPPDVELNVYRIIQQASLNAIDHAKAQNIIIRGSLEDDHIDLMVEDDGIGFLHGQSADMGAMLTKKHFGIVGMHERAALIDAKIQINSEPGQGTQVQVLWFR